MTVHQCAHPNEAEKIEPAEVTSFLIAFLMQKHKGGLRGGGGGGGEGGGVELGLSLSTIYFWN